MKTRFILTSFLLIMAISSCKKDNYQSPDAGLYGNIIDAATGKSVPQQTNVNGGYMQIFQTDYSTTPTANQTALHIDGSYTSDFIFSGQYKVVLTGPFFYIDTLKVKVSGKTKLDIKVVPYLNVSCELLGKTSTSISVRVRVTQPAQNTQKIARVAAVAGTFNTIDINNYDNVSQNGNGRAITNVQGVANTDVVVTNYDYTLSDLKPGTLYYVRGCSRTLNNGNYYNYSTMLEVTTNPQ
jgi:hypothetical protein